MDHTERQIIDELFGKLRQAETQAGPRDGQAEAHIRDQIARQPAAPYLMAQTIVMQEQALAASQARVEELERQARQRPSGGFLGGLFGGGSRSAVPAGVNVSGIPGAGPFGQAGGPDPRFAAYANPNQQRPGGGFMAGAMQTAMGVAGGMLIGSALSSAFSSGGALADEAVSQAGEHLPDEASALADFGGDEEI